MRRSKQPGSRRKAKAAAPNVKAAIRHLRTAWNDARCEGPLMLYIQRALRELGVKVD